MDLVISQHTGFLVISSKSPHEKASNFSIIDLRVHLLIFVCDLIDRCLVIIHHIFHELNGFFVFSLCPVKIISTEHIYKLCNLIVCIGFFPGSAVSISSVTRSCFHIFHEVFFCIDLCNSDFIHDFLIYPESQVSGISRNTDNVTVFICDHILQITLCKLTTDIFCHNCVVQTFQPA